MKVVRSASILLLLTAPILAFAVAGAWALYGSRALTWLLWLTPLCWAFAYLLARLWRAEFAPLSPPRAESSAQWTSHDTQALKIVAAKQQALKTISQQRLTEPQFYLDTAIDLSLQIARHYRPDAKDPISSLTVPEILAAVHLALADMEKWVRDYVPGSHLLTVRQWRLLGRAPDWMRAVSDVGWLAAILVHPANIARYFFSKWSVDSASKQVQANFLAWFYAAFVRQVGWYLIEMNGGRLRGGAERYREAVTQIRGELSGEAPGSEASGLTSPVPHGMVDVAIVVVGQVKAGKSSLINALLGERRAETRVSPVTERVEKYALELADSPNRLTLWDTAGYSGDDSKVAPTGETLRALEEADLVLLAMDASVPARTPDVALLRAMSKWFAARRRRKSPPILGVLTHIDGLPPVREWSPPYDWVHAVSPKERNIQLAVEYNRDEFRELLDGVLPACTDVDRNREYGVREWLLPVIVALLDEARACAVVRSLQNEIDSDPLGKVLQQLRRAGIGLLMSYLTGEIDRAMGPHERV
jgi:predicted GTPase